MATTEHWTEVPDEHDYAAAENYLSTLAAQDTAHRLADLLRAAPIEHYKAKDRLRASALPALDPGTRQGEEGNSTVPCPPGAWRSHVRHLPHHRDGYHRICASHYLNEDADIPCRLVDLSRR